MARLGICEDDEAVRRVLAEGLRSSGHDVIISRSGSAALRCLGTDSGCDALVIDIGLPDSDGRDVCQALRAAGQHAPVLFLTALDASHDRISGFHAGGDDYVCKPFALAEVLLRLESLLKRSRPVGGQVEGLRLDPEQFCVRHNDLQYRLTPTEFRMLAAVMAKPGVVVRRRVVVAAAWPDGAVVSENTVDSYIRRIRTKLDAVDSPVRLETVRGVGFVMR